MLSTARQKGRGLKLHLKVSQEGKDSWGYAMTEAIDLTEWDINLKDEACKGDQRRVNGKCCE